MTVRMIALRSFQYAGKRIEKGSEFDARGRLNAPGSEATTLRAIGYAQELLPTPRPTQQYQTRVMTAAPTAPATGTNLGAAALDSMDIDALRTLADRMGVKYHHFAGAARIRQLIQDAQAE